MFFGWRVSPEHVDSDPCAMAADGGSLLRALPCAFSPKSHEYLALCAQDGRLRIWDTDSKALHREYIPSAHLSATCTCISWGPCRTAKVRSEAALFRLPKWIEGLLGRSLLLDCYRISERCLSRCCVEN